MEKLFRDLSILCRMNDMGHQRLSPDELRMMADTSADPIIQRALNSLAQDVEEEMGMFEMEDEE